MKPRVASLAIAGWIAAFAPQAAAISLSGAAIDSASHAPIAGASVTLRRAADSTLVAHAATDAGGRFTLDSLRADRYRLRTTMLGYSSVSREVELSDDTPSVDLGRLSLAVAPIAIPGVHVNTERPTAILAPDRNIYLTKDLPGASTGTATDLLRTVPELDVDIDGHVSLRGSASVTIQFNGRKAPLQGDDLTNYLRQMPAARIERVEIVANPSAKFDPEGSAGILNLVLKDRTGTGWSGSFNAYGGNRYAGPSGRVALENGPLTVFGGLSQSLYRYLYDANGERLGLVTNPPGVFRWDTDYRVLGRFGNADLSADYKLGKRATLYGTINGIRYSSDTRSFTHNARADSTGTVIEQYDRTDDGSWRSRNGSVTLGVQHVVAAGKNEQSIEVLESLFDGNFNSRSLREPDVPATGDQASVQPSASGFRERSVQVDETAPLGATGKLEAGYRGDERVNTRSSDLHFIEGGVPVSDPPAQFSNYGYREVFHQGYLTLGTRIGNLSAQLGARGELARTTFEARASGARYDHRYRSLYPSANLAWDFGNGRTIRTSYSKRVERPSAYYLDPDAPFSDSLNRTVGNPALGPRYTDSWSVDANWTGSRGTLGLSPYLRQTYDNWEPITTVNASGAATTTYRNTASSRVIGATLTASLRRTKRLGGTASVGVSNDHHDASNVANGSVRDLTSWSGNANVNFKTTEKLDLSGYLRYAPSRATAQGRSSSYTALSFSARWKFDDQRSASLSLVDPFQMGKYTNTSGDATYAQTTHTNNHMRSLSGSITWNWGHEPEEKRRRQRSEAPSAEGAGSP